jgi:alpha-L-fucosidase
MNRTFFFIISLLLSTHFLISQSAPLTKPSAQQLRWHEMQYYMFIHFGVNSFTNLEWGEGAENPKIFNPTNLDTRQWASIAKKAGMKAIILTVKHHDGFCLWPSAYTEHDVANSSWKNGKGDVLKELSEACKEYGIKLGFYISPWDRNNPIYGKDDLAYNTYFKNQLKEILTQYGPIFEVWFDGANGDRENPEKYQVYDWKGFGETIRSLQPEAVIFGAGYADLRWVGNERGVASETNWCTFDSKQRNPSEDAPIPLLQAGIKNGDLWWPAETDVSIRPGWFYHPEEDTKVKSVDQLEKIYFESVGRNTNLLLNIPIDREGLVNAADSIALMQLRARLDATFIDNKLEKLSKGTPDNNAFVVELKGKKTFDVISLKENISQGQTIDGWKVEAWVDKQWVLLGEATTVGYQRWLILPKTTSPKIRISFENPLSSRQLLDVNLYLRASPNPLLDKK